MPFSGTAKPPQRGTRPLDLRGHGESVAPAAQVFPAPDLSAGEVYEHTRRSALQPSSAACVHRRPAGQESVGSHAVSY